MIRETVGNIITAKESILVFHGQKNHLFSGSVGKQIRDELVDPIMIQSIQEAADKSKLPFYLFEAKSGNWLAAVFAGDAATFKTALEAIRRLAHNRSIAIPGYLGKDWDETFSVILEVFRDYRSDVTIYYTKENAERLRGEYRNQEQVVADRDAGGFYLLRPWHGFPAMTNTLDIVHWFGAAFGYGAEPEDASNQEDACVLLQKDAVVDACKALVDSLYPAKFQEQRNWLEEQIHILTPYHEEETPEGILKILDAMKGLATLYGKDLEEKPETEEEAEEHTEEVTEVCSHCDSEVTLPWDIAESGYKAFCPYCGNRLMLCAYCPRVEQCDYDEDTDTCYYNREKQED